ncbi:MAG: hypothetical protein LBH16_06165 [Treponema sp.]|nr:hypothetical protein [Treponema sp.]
MSFFCLLWVPLFYFLRRAIRHSSSSGGVWALLLGSIMAIVQFFLGYLISPGGFGFSRLYFGFIEIVSFPVLVPLFIYTFVAIRRRFKGDIDFTNFALLWIIPVGALRAISWSSTNDPILLVIVPLLWTSIAAGIPFFIRWMTGGFRWFKAVVSIPCILIIPVLGASVYWAFFSQRTITGIILLVAANIPIAFSFARDIRLKVSSEKYLRFILRNA